MLSEEEKSRKSKNLLIRSEQEALDLSLDERVSSDLRQKLSPEKTQGGWNSSFYLHALTDEKAVQVTSVYKPRRGVLGGKDGRLIYKALNEPYLFELLSDSQGSYLTFIHDSHQQVRLKESFDFGKAPESIEVSGKKIERYQRPIKTIPAEEECLREALFSVLTGYLEEKLKLCPPLGIADFGYPKTTIEALAHPSFGPHHTVGSHQIFMPKIKPLANHFHFIPPKIQLSGFAYKIPCEQCLKIGIPRLIAHDLDCRLSNLFLRNGELLQIDAGACFPHFQGLHSTAHAAHQWMYLPRGFSKIPDVWRTFGSHLDGDELLELFRQSIKEMNQRFPQEAFTFPIDCEVVVYAGVQLVKYGIQLGIPINQLGYFQQRIAKTDRKGRPLYNKNGKKLFWPSSFWTAIEIAIQESGTDLSKNPLLLNDFKKRLEKQILIMVNEVYRWET